jgi:hypothetical protein
MLRRRLETTDQLVMDDADLLAQIMSTVRKAQSAFQNLCRDGRAIYGPDSRDLLALDASLSALGNIIELLEGIESRGGQFDLIHSVLVTSMAPSLSGDMISIAEAIIWDMCNLEKCLVDVQSDTITRSSASVPLLPPGEAMSIHRMLEKYYSIMNNTSKGQLMCVNASEKFVHVLKS